MERVFDFTRDYQTIAYLFIIILLIVNMIFTIFSKNNVKILSKQLLAWIIIFLIICVGYAFKFELNYLSQRVLSVLIPSYSWVDSQGRIVISRGSDSHFYINAIVNGIMIKFMVDTGASDVALTLNDAKKLKLDLSKLNYNKTYSTANGIITGASIRLDSMEIGAGIFKNVEAHLGSGNLDVSLLGMSVLERFKVFKIDRDMLILEY
jgi:aspartyl protease family protein